MRRPAVAPAAALLRAASGTRPAASTLLPGVLLAIAPTAASGPPPATSRTLPDGDAGTPPVVATRPAAPVRPDEI